MKELQVDKEKFGVMANNISIEDIKDALVISCITYKPLHFKPFLLSELVTVDGPDKESFYKFFKYMNAVCKKTSTGELILKIEKPEQGNNQIQHYCFYDTVHLHPRLTIMVVETTHSIHLEVLPF